MPAKFDLKARVVENVCLQGMYFRLRVEAPEIASMAKPGQFCMIRPEFSGDSLLRRPFSIASVREGNLLEFAYTTIGVGTRLLSRAEPGESILCLGPLGNSFPIVEGVRPFVVAGGIGVAPFPFLNEVLNAHRVFPRTYYGARSAGELIYVEELNRLSEKLVFATDDGTRGFHGLVTEPFEKELESDAAEAVVYACGPHPMLHAVKKIAERHGVPAFLSMEETMGCGIGICVGCPIPGITAEGKDIYYLCCKDGPIFPSTMIRV